MDYKAAKQDRLSEAFKDSVSHMRSVERDGHESCDLWTPTAKEESRRYRRINGCSDMSTPLNVNQQAAFDRAIKQEIEGRI